MDFNFADIAKIFLAALVGAVIGAERETHGQSAGIRTNVLVCLGACLMMLLSLNLHKLFLALGPDKYGVQIDPGRIASYAIASMGFLGAGAIIKGKGSVKGLTTAAGLWLVTGLGLAIGAGYIVPALVATALSLIALFLPRIVRLSMTRTEFILLTIRHAGDTTPVPEIKRILSEYAHMNIHFINYMAHIGRNEITYRIRLSHRAPVVFEDVLRRLTALGGVLEVNWEESDIP